MILHRLCNFARAELLSTSFDSLLLFQTILSSIRAAGSEILIPVLIAPQVIDLLLGGSRYCLILSTLLGEWSTWVPFDQPVLVRQLLSWRASTPLQVTQPQNLRSALTLTPERIGRFKDPLDPWSH